MKKVFFIFFVIISFKAISSDLDNDLLPDNLDLCQSHSGLSSSPENVSDILFFQHCVEISSGIPEIKFQIKLSDNFSTIDTIRLLFWPEGKEQTWVVLARHDEGYFELLKPLHKNATSSSYNVRKISVLDNDRNELEMTESQLKLMGYTTSYSFINPVSDDEEPQVSSLTTDGWSIDYDSIPRINFTIEATDNLSGVQSNQTVLELESPTGSSVFEYGQQTGENQYSFSFALDPFAASGNYKINTIRLYDYAGNKSFSLAFLKTINSVFTLENTQSDDEAPVASQARLSATLSHQIDRPVLIVDVKAQDKASGVKSAYVRLVSPSGVILDSWADKTGVDGNNDVFRAEIPLPLMFESGSYKIHYLNLTDFAENTDSIKFTDLESLPESTSRINLYYPGDMNSLNYAIDGSSENDYVIGANRSDDVLTGFSGDDFLYSGNGEDEVYAGSGNDIVVGGSGAGNDKYFGDDGNDSLVYTSAMNSIFVNFKNNSASGDDIGNDEFYGFESLISGEGHDLITTHDFATKVDGNKGNDQIISNGTDILLGGQGNDEFIINMTDQNRIVSIEDYENGESLVIESSEKLIDIAWSNTFETTFANVEESEDLYVSTSESDTYFLKKQNGVSTIVIVKGVLNKADIMINTTTVNDYDRDGLFDAFDQDDDNDSIDDILDAFPFNIAASTDTDGDGQPDTFLNSCDHLCVAESGLTLDLDDDNDGYSDEDELANQTDPLSADSVPADHDGDFLSDLNDSDDDNDGVEDSLDAFPFDASRSQTELASENSSSSGGSLSFCLLVFGLLANLRKNKFK
ncbi:MAG: calcium-binding protein [Pseudomonadota bacterium]